MTKAKAWVVAVDSEDVTGNDGTTTTKYYAWADSMEGGQNLVSWVKQLKFAYLCRTKTEAREMATTFNEDYKRNGTFLFDDL